MRPAEHNTSTRCTRKCAKTVTAHKIEAIEAIEAVAGLDKLLCVAVAAARLQLPLELQHKLSENP